MSDTDFSGDHLVRAVVAREAGNAFLIAAEGPFRAFCSRYLEPTGNKVAPKFKDDFPALRMIGELSPIIACMSFSVELLTKVALAQDSQTKYKTHDLHKLWKKLKQERRSRIAELYPGKCEQWERMDFPINQISIGGTDVVNRGRADANDINAAMEQLGVAFVEWRYFYESLPLVGDVTKVSSFDFKSAFACAQAIAEEIANMPGGFTTNIDVSIGRSPRS